MKRKNKLFSLIGAFLVLSIIAFYSCNKEEINKSIVADNAQASSNRTSTNTDRHFISSLTSGNLLLTYEALTNNGITTSSLKIVDNSNNRSKEIETKYLLNEKLTSYKLISHEAVIAEAEKQKKNFSIEEIEKIALLFENFGKSIVEEAINISSPLIQSVYFHHAILSTIKRCLNNEACGCTPDPGYFVDKKSFWCQEDYFIDPSQVFDGFKNNLALLDTTGMKVYAFLEQNKNSTRMPLDKLYNTLESKDSFISRVSRAYFSSQNPGDPVERCM